MTGLDVTLLTRESLPGLRAWAEVHSDAIGVDTETTGLDVWEPTWRCTHVAVGAVDGTAWVVDGRDTELVRDALSALAGFRLWAHNAGYDREALAAGYRVAVGLLCTLTLAKAIRPERASFGLKVLRPATADAQDALRVRWAQHTGVAVDALPADWLPQACATLPADDPAILAYVAGDAVECARLVAELRDGASSDARNCATKEAKVDRLWHAATMRGYRVDLARLAETEATLEAARALSTETWGVDLTTTSNASRAWVAERGIRIVDAEGADTMSKDFYDAAYVPPEAAEDWAAFRGIKEVARTRNFLSGLRSHLAGDRIHPDLNVLGTHTGRMSSSGPNLQNISPDMRPIFCAEDGFVLLGADFDSVEPRVMAALSKDAAALAAVQAGDVYTDLAVQVWGESARGDKTKRGIAKTAFLAVGYGQGARSLSQRLNVSEVEAAEILTHFREAFPVLRSWSRQKVRESEREQWHTTGYGRHLPRPMDHPRDGEAKAFRIVNWIVQGTGADVLKRVTLNISAALGPQALWLPIHDELILQVPDTEAGRKDGLAALSAAMNFTFEGVPVSATPEVVGHRWYKLGTQPEVAPAPDMRSAA